MVSFDTNLSFGYCICIPHWINSYPIRVYLDFANSVPAPPKALSQTFWRPSQFCKKCWKQGAARCSWGWSSTRSSWWSSRVTGMKWTNPVVHMSDIFISYISKHNMVKLCRNIRYTLFWQSISVSLYLRKVKLAGTFDCRPSACMHKDFGGMHTVFSTKWSSFHSISFWSTIT